MQTSLFFILLVTSAQDIVTKASISKEQLPAPSPTKLVLFDPSGLIIKWVPVQSNLEPVLGYKVRLWEARDKLIHSFEVINGKSFPVVRTEKPMLMEFSPSDGKFYEYVLRGADHSQLIINHIKEDTPYNYRVLAFGTSGDGEPSSLIGFQRGGDNNDTTTAKLNEMY